MSHKGIVLFQTPGKIIPAKTLEDANKLYPSCVGIAIADGKELSADYGKVPSPARLIKTCETFKDEGLMMYLGNYPSGWKDQEQQPFTVLKDDNEQIVLAFVTGNFPGFFKDDGLSQHYHFALSHIMPTMSDLWNSCGKDFGKFKSSLNFSMIRNSMTAGAVKLSHVILLLKDGTNVTYNKDGEIVKTDFGWQSHALGKIEEPRAAEPAKKRGLAAEEELPEPEEPAEPVELPEPEEPEEPDEPITAPGKTDTAIPTGGSLKPLPQYCERRNGNEVWFTPPPKLGGNALKKLYNRIPGFLPDGKSKDDWGNTYGHWKHSTPSVRLQKDKLKGFDVLALVDTTKLTAKPATEPAAKPAAPVTAPATAPAEPGKTGPENVGDYVISPAVNKKIEAHLATPKVKAILDEHMRKTISPNALQEQEKKLPRFEESLGRPKADTARWSISDLVEIGKIDVHALAVFAAGWKNEALMHYDEEELAELNSHIKAAPSTSTQTVPERRKAKLA